MTVKIGSKGKLEITELFEDFLTITTATVATSGVATRQANVLVYNVNASTSAAGTVATTVDEPGGIMALTNATADNSNMVIFTSPLKPADGGCVMEARFKVDTATLCATFCGFTQTLSSTTAVCPAEYATSSLTINGTGGVVGMLDDADATTDMWRAVAGDGGAAATGAPVLASHTQGDDAWDVVRVEIDSNGDARCFLAENDKGLKLIKSFTTPVVSTDVFYPCLINENRSGAARKIEVDYFYVRGYRDWTI